MSTHPSASVKKSSSTAAAESSTTESPNEDVGLQIGSPTRKPDTEDPDDKRQRRLSNHNDGDEKPEKERIIRFFTTTLPRGPPLGDSDAWRDLSEHWKNDPDVALAAWKRSFVCMAPPCLSKELIQQEVQNRSIKWERIPIELAKDESFVRSVLQCLENRSLYYVAADLPQLFHDRNVWKTLVIPTPYRTVDLLVMMHAPEFIKSDPEIMLKAIEVGPAVWVCVHDDLRRSESFAWKAIETNPVVLRHLTMEEQRMFPDLVKASLKPYQEKADRQASLAERLHQDFWQDREFVLAWFRAGLQYVEATHPVEFRSDPEIFLLIAAHCNDYWKMGSFAYASQELRGNKDFMMQAVSNDAGLYWCASDKLRRENFDLVLLAFAGCPENRVDDFSGRSANFQYFSECYQKIQAGLEVHAIFIQTVLCGISLDPHCSLNLLNQGEVTLEAFKKSLASYLGVPTGTKLRLYRQASANMARVFG